MDAVARFAELVARPDPPLDQAALALAAGADPTLDPAPWLAELDRLAAGVDSLDELVHRLFVAEAFAGNERDYQDPRNSLLQPRAGPPARDPDHARRGDHRGRAGGPGWRWREWACPATSWSGRPAPSTTWTSSPAGGR